MQIISSEIRMSSNVIFHVQSNFNGLNTFRTMKICSRQGYFELVSVNHSARTGGKVEIYFRLFNMTVYSVVSLESPHRGDSNEYTKYTKFNIKKKITLYYPKSAAIGFFSNGLKNGFETAVVNKPSVFEPLKFYCTLYFLAGL